MKYILEMCNKFKMLFIVIWLVFICYYTLRVKDSQQIANANLNIISAELQKIIVELQEKVNE